MIKHSILLLLLILFTGSCFAQISDFDLSDYKLPKLNRKTLDLHLLLSDSNDNTKYPEADSSYNFRGGYQRYGTNNRNQYSIIIFPHYTHYINSARLQKKSIFDLNFQTDFDDHISKRKMINEGNNFNIVRLNADLKYRADNRIYYSMNNFIETDIVVKYIIDKNEHEENQSNSGQYSRIYNEGFQTINIDIPIKLGYGRIEQIQDARQAIYILDELSKAGKVEANYEKEDILNLAAFISELNNKRFFDTRNRRKYEYASLDSFLTNNGYLLKSDMDYFSTLSEYWLYGGLQIRNSGSRFSFIFEPGYLGNFYKFNDDRENISEVGVYDYDIDSYVYYSTTSYDNVSNICSANILNIKAGLEYLYENPIDLKWQNTISIYTNGGLLKGKIKGERYNSTERDGPTDDYSYFSDTADTLKTKLQTPYFELGFSQSIGWFPNTRTAISFSFSGKYAQLFDETGEDNSIVGFDAEGIELFTDLNVDYYISPKLRFNASWLLFYNRQNSINELMINFDSSGLGIAEYYSDQYIYSSNQPTIYKRRRFQNHFKISLTYSIF